MDNVKTTKTKACVPTTLNVVLDRWSKQLERLRHNFLTILTISLNGTFHSSNLKRKRERKTRKKKRERKERQERASVYFVKWEAL
jgi:hypothetical protein